MSLCHPVSRPYFVATTPAIYYSPEAQCGSGAPSGGHALELGVQFNDGLGLIPSSPKEEFLINKRFVLSRCTFYTRHRHHCSFEVHVVAARYRHGAQHTAHARRRGSRLLWKG